MTKLNAKEKNRPSAIDTTTQAESWPPHLDVLNQIMTPIQLLNDDSLQQELDFYTRAQFKLADVAASTTSTSAATTPIVTATAGNVSYFDSLNMPSDQHNTNQYANDPANSYASLLFNSQQQQHANDGSLLLAHGIYTHIYVVSLSFNIDVVTAQSQGLINSNHCIQTAARLLIQRQTRPSFISMHIIIIASNSTMLNKTKTLTDLRPCFYPPLLRLLQQQQHQHFL